MTKEEWTFLHWWNRLSSWGKGIMFTFAPPRNPKMGWGNFRSLNPLNSSTEIWEEVIVGDDELIGRPYTGDVKSFIRLANEKIFTETRNRLMYSPLSFPFLRPEMPPYLIYDMIERHLKDQNDEPSG